MLSGHILANEGHGYDGEYYVRMVQSGFSAGIPSMRLRPVVLLINRAVNSAVFRDPVRTFRAMNLVYAGMLAIGLSVLCLQYGATTIATTVLIISLFLCISVSKMFAFYPTLVDLGVCDDHVGGVRDRVGPQGYFSVPVWRAWAGACGAMDREPPQGGRLRPTVS